MPQIARISLVGRPNAGKSTLLNCLLNRKLGIVSPKANTTRFSIWGTTQHTAEDGVQIQICVTDTPGWDTTPKGKLGRIMTAHARSEFCAAACIGLVIDGASALREHDRMMYEEARKMDIPVEIILTKTDLVKPRDKLLPKIAEIQSWGYEGVVWPVSACASHKNHGMDKLHKAILSHLTDGEYAEEESSLTKEKFAAECVREHAFRLLNQEIPYHLYTKTNVLHKTDDGIWEIHCAILLDEERHKPIILGKGGQMIKRIGSRARSDLIKAWGEGVRLWLVVKISGKEIEIC